MIFLSIDWGYPCGWDWVGGGVAFTVLGELGDGWLDGSCLTALLAAGAYWAGDPGSCLIFTDD